MTYPLWDGSRYIEVNVQEAGREVCIAGKTIHFDPKSYPILHYVYAGKGKLEYRGKSYNLRSGDCFYIAPGEVATYSASEDDPWSYFWIGLGGTKAQPLLESVEFSHDKPVQRDTEKAWKRYFEAVYESYFGEGEFSLACLGNAYLLINSLASGKNMLSYELEKGHISAAKAFIRNNYQFPITMVDVAKSVGVTSNYLANLFQSEGECTPKSYLIQVRMEAATKMLMETDYPIGDIARSCGYKNPLHFSKAYKDYSGMSPLHYRNKGEK